jgi:exopolyphosphatase
MRERKSDRLLAVVDLGSNSFRLEIGRVEGDQIYQLDTWRETLRFGAGVDQKGRLTQSAMKAALACLARFRERLSGLHPAAVRVVATNTFRVAKNAEEFVALAERTLGLPIDVISGHEEGRLTFFGVAHELPPSTRPRLVIDIGGGSTEFIIGRGFEPERLESLSIGCVGMTQRFFRDGSITKAGLDAAEMVARSEIEAIAGAFAIGAWHEAYGSSGTAVALADILEQNAFSGGGVTPTGLARLRRHMLEAGHVSRLKLNALKGERAPVLAGGYAIMAAAVTELKIERIDPSEARCGSECSMTSWAARSTKTRARRPSSASLPAMESIARKPCESATSRARSTSVRSHRPMRRSRSSSSGRAVARGRHVDLARRIPQARRLHRRARGHAGLLLARAGQPRVPRPRVPRPPREGGRAPRAARVSARPVLALRLAVLVHHARTAMAVPRITLRVAHDIRFGISRRWLGNIR